MSNQENKDTLFSSTLKVQEGTVPLYSKFEVKWQRYGYFVILTWLPNKASFLYNYTDISPQFDLKSIK